MANVRAIAAVTNALVERLRRALAGAPREAGVFAIRTSDLATPPSTGITVCLFRVEHEAPFLHVAPPRHADGPPHPAPWRLELHYLVTAWAGDAALQQELLARAASGLAAAALLAPESLVGGAASDERVVGEAVAVVATSTPFADLVDLWRSTGAPMQPSLTCVARIVRIDAAGA